MSHDPTSADARSEVRARGAERGSAVGAAVGASAAELAARVAAGAAAGASAGAGGLAGVLREARGTVASASEVLEGVVEDALDRAGVVRWGRKPPSRWPWAAAAAAAGAAAGAGAVLLLRRVVGQDAPGAQEPEQLQAVVDTGSAGTSGTVRSLADRRR